MTDISHVSMIFIEEVIGQQKFRSEMRTIAKNMVEVVNVAKNWHTYKQLTFLQG